MRRIGTASFNDGEEIRRKFASTLAKWDSWRELLPNQYSYPSTGNVRIRKRCQISKHVSEFRNLST